MLDIAEATAGKRKLEIVCDRDILVSDYLNRCMIINIFQRVIELENKFCK